MKVETWALVAATLSAPLLAVWLGRSFIISMTFRFRIGKK